MMEFPAHLAGLPFSLYV